MRILYLAIADGRGHLMRAQLLRRLLGVRGIDVDIATTSEAGTAFLRGFGVDARVLPEAFDLQFDAQHRLDERATREKLLQTLSPLRAAAQLRTLEEWSEGADLVVNDSMYPVLLLEAAWRRRMRVVQVVGENIYRSSWTRVGRERVPALRFAGEILMRRAFDRSFARVFHTLETPSVDDARRSFHLPPLVATPARAPDAIRRGERVAAVYLNPHYRDERIAAAIETAARANGLRLEGVSEAFGGVRPGWRARDEHFVDIVNAADVLISGAGMAALEQSRAFGVPLVAILGRQPEQEANVTERAVFQILRADSPVLEHELSAALSALPARSASRLSAAETVQKQWASIFESLVHAAHKEHAHEEDGRVGHRDGEPEGRRSAAR